jgi:hypothetical protein
MRRLHDVVTVRRVIVDGRLVNHMQVDMELDRLLCDFVLLGGGSVYSGNLPAPPLPTPDHPPTTPWSALPENTCVHASVSHRRDSTIKHGARALKTLMHFLRAPSRGVGAAAVDPGVVVGVDGAAVEDAPAVVVDGGFVVNDIDENNLHVVGLYAHRCDACKLAISNSWFRIEGAPLGDDLIVLVRMNPRARADVGSLAGFGDIRNVVATLSRTAPLRLPRQYLKHDGVRAWSLAGCTDGFLDADGGGGDALHGAAGRRGAAAAPAPSSAAAAAAAGGGSGGGSDGGAADTSGHIVVVEAASTDVPALTSPSEAAGAGAAAGDGDGGGDGGEAAAAGMEGGGDDGGGGGDGDGTSLAVGHVPVGVLVSDDFSDELLSREDGTLHHDGMWHRLDLTSNLSGDLTPRQVQSLLSFRVVFDEDDDGTSADFPGSVCPVVVSCMLLLSSSSSSSSSSLLLLLFSDVAHASFPRSVAHLVSHTCWLPMRRARRCSAGRYIPSNAREPSLRGVLVPTALRGRGGSERVSRRMRGLQASGAC